MIGAIPEIGDPEEYGSREFLDSAFVELTDDEHFDIQMMYSRFGMENAEKRCLVRREVRERLLAASELLPRGMKLRLWDAWRPFALQEELYHTYFRQLVETFDLEKVSETERNRVIAQFVSVPVRSREMPPVHTTGGAVDITILDSDGRELEMGTAFDAFSQKAHTAFFESEGGGQIRDNRRLLYHVMTQAGFTNLPSEWWHFDYGDKFWGFYKKKPAIYGGIFTREEIHEKDKERKNAGGSTEKD